MILFLLVFASSLYADDPSVEKYCYSSAQEMQRNLTRARGILVPSDQVTEDDSCFVIQMRPHRRELIQTYLRQLNPNVSISFSSADLRRDPCKLKVEKIGALNSNKTSGSVNLKGLQVSEQTTESKSVDTMQITTLNEFELTVNQQTIQGRCRFIAPTRYEISLEVRKDAKPLLPPVPAGTVVILKTNELPPAQQTSKLQTTLQLNQGERIEIGSLVKNLQDKNSEIKLDPAASANLTDGANTEKVFLSLD